MDVPKPAKVRMRHTAEDVADAYVPPSAVPHWQRAGWEVAEGAPTAVDALVSAGITPEKAAEIVKTTPERPARRATRRRDSKESD